MEPDMTQPASPDAPEVETTTTTHEETTTTETSPVQPEPETEPQVDPLGEPTPDHEQPAAPYVNAPNGDSDDAQPQ